MKRFLITVLIFIVAITAGTIYMMRQQKPEENKKKDKIIKRKECVPFTGGAFHLLFYKEENAEPENMHVCIACSPDSYLDLPIPEKEGYDFEGWYYDKEFTKKVEVKNSREITPVPEKDGDCIIGYQDISLYAKWSKKEEPVPEPVQEKKEDSAPEPVATEEPVTIEETSTNIFKRPTGYGQLKRDNQAKYRINTRTDESVFSISSGRVHKIITAPSSITDLLGRPVHTVSIIYLVNDEAYLENYYYLHSVKVHEGENVTADTFIGNVAKIQQELPRLYLDIYKYSNLDSLYNDYGNTIAFKRKPMPPFEVIDIPESGEWDSR